MSHPGTIHHPLLCPPPPPHLPSLTDGDRQEEDHQLLDGEETSLTPHLPDQLPHLSKTPLLSQARGTGADSGLCLRLQDHQVTPLSTPAAPASPASPAPPPPPASLSTLAGGPRSTCTQCLPILPALHRDWQDLQGWAAHQAVLLLQLFLAQHLLTQRISRQT